MMTHQVRNQL